MLADIASAFPEDLVFRNHKLRFVIGLGGRYLLQRESNRFPNLDRSWATHIRFTSRMTRTREKPDKDWPHALWFRRFWGGRSWITGRCPLRSKQPWSCCFK